MKRLVFILMLICCSSLLSYSQGHFTVPNKSKSDKVRFQLISNLVIVPVEINGVKLSFLLDTGVSKPILFGFLNDSDSLELNKAETVLLRGLGDREAIEAIRSEGNMFRIGDAVNVNQEIFAVFDPALNFAPRLGIPVHGIIGYDLFKDLIVEVNYVSRYIRLTQPEAYKYKKCKKCEVVPLDFYNKKPYVNAEVSLNQETIPVKLLLDSGGADALWLFEDYEQGIKSSNEFFHDFLGFGLGGSVYGKRSKVETFSLSGFELNGVNVSYPDSNYIGGAKRFKERNGSLAGHILKRFNMIIDYPNQKITLKKNKYFKESFSYNKSGIELQHEGIRLVKEEVESKGPDNLLSNDYETKNQKTINVTRTFKLAFKPAFSIVELREGSPAARAGLQVGDVIISVNNKESYHYSLQEIIKMFYDDDGKRIKLEVERDGSVLSYEFKLESLL
ncbi:retropepsin-like aspartic protease [Mangrovimonas aestuarii]|uniref:retropepsin-like aspartic protease n=1 Tax=Mangrovimonas aestuarii TaxID=3018443 RepID=UPI0023781BD7|nr:PDZ domain-containing protein [Mangrovimonas aestuarii]